MWLGSSGDRSIVQREPRHGHARAVGVGPGEVGEASRPQLLQELARPRTDVQDRGLPGEWTPPRATRKRDRSGASARRWNRWVGAPGPAPGYELRPKSPRHSTAAMSNTVRPDSTARCEPAGQRARTTGTTSTGGNGTAHRFRAEAREPISVRVSASSHKGGRFRGRNLEHSTLLLNGAGGNSGSGRAHPGRAGSGRCSDHHGDAVVVRFGARRRPSA